MSHPFPGPPPPAPFGPRSTLMFTVQGSVMTSSLVPPKLSLNGYPVAVGYGLNTIPVPAGPLRIEVHSQWLRRYGEAALDCTMPPNQAVPVFYAPPYHQFTSGSIGHTTMSRKGVGALVAQLVLIALLVVLVPLAVAVTAIP